MTLAFSNRPKRLVEITLGTWQRAALPPGFSHTIAVVAGIICYCQENDLYPIINDAHWCYGKWTDCLMPFWNEEERANHLASTEKTIVDLNYADRRGQDHGMGFLDLPYVRDRWKTVASQILCVNQETQDRIGAELTSFPARVDLAVHVRLGYEDARGRYSIEQYAQKIRDLIQRHDLPHAQLFVMTDTRLAVEYLEDVFGRRVLTLCPTDYDGVARHIRHASNLYLLLKELTVARHARYFIGKGHGVAEMGHILRRYQDSFVI